MKNILDSSTQKEIENRINSLNEKAQRLWGKMSVNEMVCHCSDQIKMAVGEISTKYVGNFFLETLVKHLILFGIPAPKGKVETVPELKQGIGGTKPTLFDKDKTTLLDFIRNFQNRIEKKSNHSSSGIWKINNKTMGKIVLYPSRSSFKTVFCLMKNQIKPRLDFLIEQLKNDFDLISKKKKDDEWKRDHFRYTFTVHVQRIYEMLNTSITKNLLAEIQPSTKKEMVLLKDYLDKMIDA
jgi:hypothetical protein